MPAGSDHLNPNNPPDTPPAPQPPPGKPGPGPAESTAGPGKKKPGKVDLSKYKHLRDKNGFSFDAAIHQTKRDGSPIVSKNGLLCLRPGQRPKGNKSFVYRGAPADAPPGSEEGAPPPGTEAAHYAAAGAVMAATLVQIGRIVGGEEWNPRAGEQEALADAWGGYFRDKQIRDIPPGVAVTIATFGYVLPRLAMPKTAGKVAGARAWLASKFSKGKKRKAPPPAPEKQETAGDGTRSGR